MSSSRKDFHNVCKHLKEQVEKNQHDKYAGICGNLQALINSYDRIEELMHEYQVDWPLYSGDKDFPVPHESSGMAPDEAYYTSVRMWDGEYGRNRKNLLDYLIEVTA
jgi:hypothetical protein